MVSENMIKNCRCWFTEYVNGFYKGHFRHDSNIRLKEDHTARVCEAMTDICNFHSPDTKFSRLAWLSALFHDVGRFRQYSSYGTFVDRKSVDHAKLGVDILTEKHILDELSHREEELILKAVKYHNRPFLPENEDKECLFLTGMVRDADKIDIFKVVTDYYTDLSRNRNNELELNLPDDVNVSPEVLDAVRSGSVILSRDINYLNDFKLLQMNWVSDLNFRRSLELLQEKNYLNIIRDSISVKRAGQEAWEIISGRLNSILKSDFMSKLKL